jgi:restriction system protein
MKKAEAYLNLVRKRQSDTWVGYHNLSEYHGGLYECDHVCPNSLFAGDLNAKVMVMMQDWASDERLRRPATVTKETFLGFDPDLRTNINLGNYLNKYLGMKFEDTFITNLFPFIKNGAMNASISHKDMVRAAREFAMAQIEIVKPEIVLVFGMNAFNALRVASGLKKVGNMDEAASAPFVIGESKVMFLPHPGQIGTNVRNKGGVNRVEKDWLKVAECVR